MDSASEKKTIREKMRKMRLEQSEDLARTLAYKAQQHVLATAEWRKAKSVALYAATKGEVSADLLFDEALAANKAVWFPRVRLGSQGMMDFVRVTAHEDLKVGRFGILEPVERLPGLGSSLFVCDLAIIPGLAFDRHGVRLGFGGGYYDRFFAVAPVKVRIGLCYDFQIVSPLKAEKWDVHMTHLCSESGMFHCPRR